MKIFILLLFTSLAFSQNIEFKKLNKKVKILSIKKLRKISEEKIIQIHDPFQSSRFKYKVFRVKNILHKIFGRSWKKFDRVQFTCKDGFKPEVPIKLIIKYDAFFAFSYEDENKSFKIFNRSENSKAQLGPLYMMWMSKKKDFKKEVTPSFWPYQIVAINLINKNDPFEKLKPLDESSSAYKGYKLFKRYCISCHKVNGIGGDKSIDLMSSKSIKKNFDATWLKRFILNPRKVVPDSKMPMMPLNLKNRGTQAKEIVEFLEFIKNKKN